MIWVFIRTAPLDLTDPRSNVFPTVSRCDVVHPLPQVVLTPLASSTLNIFAQNSNPILARDDRSFCHADKKPGFYNSGKNF